MSESITALPVLALRGMVVFPEQTVHFDVGRLKSALAQVYDKLKGDVDSGT